MDAPTKSSNWIFGIIFAFSIVGLVAAFTLSVERIQQLIDPAAPLTCNFNLILNCGTVMQTWQAKVFGFPNSFIGLMAYPVLITLAVGYFAGARYKRWFLIGLQLGTTLGLIFAYWLFFQSVYAIQVLCPWCLLVTIATTMIFEATTRYNLLQNTFKLPGKIQSKVELLLKKDIDKFVVAGWLALMTLLVFIQFPDIVG